MNKYFKVFFLFFIFSLIVYKINVFADDDECIETLGMQSTVLSFVTGNEEIIDDVEFCNTCAESVPSLPKPQAVPGKSFLGWYTKENDGVKLEVNNLFGLEDEEVTKEEIDCNKTKYTLYALWEDAVCPSTGNLTVIVNYETNGGDNIDSKTYVIPHSFNNLSDDDCSFPLPNRDGYDFLGWYADSELTIPISNLKDGDDDKLSYESVYNLNGCLEKNITTIYAKWEQSEIVEVDNTASYILKFPLIIAVLVGITGSLCVFLNINNQKKNEGGF